MVASSSPYKMALEMVERFNRSVIPLGTNKKPCVKWKIYQTQLPTSDEIDYWERTFHPPAWAMITGTLSKIFTLDFDGEKGKKTFEAWGLKAHRLSGSGYPHVDFIHPGFRVKTLNHVTSKGQTWTQTWPGFDIKGDGGYAVIYGRNSKGPYTWLRDFEPDPLDILPAEFLHFLGNMEPPRETNWVQWGLDRIGVFGGRNNSGFQLACQLRDNRVPYQSAEDFICDYARRVPPYNTKGERENYTEQEALASLKSAYASPAREAWKHPKTAEIPWDASTSPSGNGNGARPTQNTADSQDDISLVLNCLKQGEWGDSLLFAHLFRGQVIYDHIEKEWYLFRGHSWIKDFHGRVKHYVSGKLAGHYIMTSAQLLTDKIDNDKEKTARLVKELTTRALALRSVARCKNILTFASSHEGMGITADEWDINKWLLALPNGVIDLRTSKCRPGKPEDYIRTVAPTRWQGIDAPAPRFERFLEEVFADLTDDMRRVVIAFLQRLLGYGITGEVSEHIFAVLYGEDGRNGKDTLQHALTRTLGAASAAISKDVFLDMGKQHAAGGATPHLCDLQGKRLAWASEPEKGMRFNVGQVKELSGGGEIPVRPLYAKDYYKIQPTHLLILLTNHKPHADATDSAFWDRLRLITFNMRFVDNPKPDTNERKKDVTLWPALEQEASGILAWLVRGCLLWQSEGLNTPQCIIDAGNAYRKEEDNIGQFIEERCDISDKVARTQASKIYTAYSVWCEAGNMKPLNSTNFGRQLSKRFTKDPKPTRNGIFYHGIRVLPPPDGGESVNGLWTTKKTVTPALQVASGSSDKSDCEQCEGFLQEVPKIRKGDIPIESLSGKTLHTIHSDTTKEGLDQPVEQYQGTVNSPKNPSHSAKEALLFIGEKLGFPRLEYRPGHGILAGRDAWEKTIARIDDSSASATRLAEILAFANGLLEVQS